MIGFFRTKTRSYRALRSALDEAESRLPDLIQSVAPHLSQIPVRLSVIDQVALDAWQEQWVPLHRPSMPGRFPWDKDRQSLEKTPERFEVAIWSGSSLCGLGLGKPSEKKTILWFNLLEGSPLALHPLKGAIRFIAIDAAFAYAETLGAAELRLVEPDPGVIACYQEMGFSLDGMGGKPPYCAKRVKS